MAGHDAYRMSERDRILAVVPMFHAMGWNLGYLAGRSAPTWSCRGRFAPVRAPRAADRGGAGDRDLRRADDLDGHAAICGRGRRRPQQPRAGDLRRLPRCPPGADARLRGATRRQGRPGLGDDRDAPRRGACTRSARSRRRRRNAGPSRARRPPHSLLRGADRRRRRRGDAERRRRSTGEIEIRGPTVVAEYFENPEASAAAMHDGWLRTGDVGTLDAEGWLRITDRAKDVIKSGGEWISSVDLESALMAHPAVVEAAVIALPDERWSERPLPASSPRRSAPRSCVSSSRPGWPNGGCRTTSPTSRRSRRRAWASSTRRSCGTCSRPTGSPAASESAETTTKGTRWQRESWRERWRW